MATKKVEEKQEEISLIDLFAVLLRYKFFIFGCTVVGGLISIFISVLSLKLPPKKSFFPNKYTPNAVMLISENTNSLGVTGNMASLASLAGVNVGGSVVSNASLAQYLASSNLLFDALNEKFDFVKRYKIEKSPISNVRKTLGEKLTNKYDKATGVFTISFTDIDPELAKEVVNFSVEWLSNKFVELGVDKNNIEKANLEKNIDIAYSEILRLEQATQELGSSINNTVNIWNTPSVSIETSKIQMELQAQKQVYTSLKSQYELLKVQMQSEQPVFQILEMAEVPDQKSGPSRGKLCIVITFASFFISVLMAFLMNAIKNIKNDPVAMNKLKGVKPE